MYVARLSQFMELDALSDLEFGVSAIGPLDGDAVDDRHRRATCTSSYWTPTSPGAAATTETRRRELAGAGRGHAARDIDDDGAGVFPDGRRRRLVAHRAAPDLAQLSTWACSTARATCSTARPRTRPSRPTSRWYADEFFRIRAQFEHLTRDGHGTEPDISDANRLLCSSPGTSACTARTRTG